MNLAFYFSYIYYEIKNYLNPKIKILHFSNNYLVIDKKYDLKINSNNKNENTVQTLLKKLYPYLANNNLYHEYYFPHRLDFATSGLMCIPLHKKACSIISDTFSTRKSKKYYIALVRGLFSKEIFDLNMPIGEDIREKSIQKMCTADSEYCIKARTARTMFLVLEEGLYDDYLASKILIRPVTGRRHQIRTHCTFLGHTIIGDYTYSNRKDVRPFRMFLHSLRLVLPNTLESLDVETDDPFGNVKEWISIKTVNNFDKLIYKKFDIFL